MSRAAPFCLFPFPQSQVLPKRIPIAEIRLGKHLVDHRDGRRAGPVALLKITAGPGSESA
jgi:hypothetical protein